MSVAIVECFRKHPFFQDLDFQEVTDPPSSEYLRKIAKKPLTADPSAVTVEVEEAVSKDGLSVYYTFLPIEGRTRDSLTFHMSLDSGKCNAVTGIERKRPSEPEGTTISGMRQGFETTTGRRSPGGLRCTRQGQGDIGSILDTFLKELEGISTSHDHDDLILKTLETIPYLYKNFQLTLAATVLRLCSVY